MSFWIKYAPVSQLNLICLPNRKLADMRAAERKYRERSDKVNNGNRPEIKKDRAIFDQLNMVGSVKVKNLPKEIIKKESDRYDEFLLLMLKANGVNPENDHGPSIDSEDMDPQTFDISDLFDDWCSKARGEDKSCLFRELNEATVQKLLSKGQWNFKAIAEEEADKGIDEGGLTRIFLEKCWTQLGKLCVVVEGRRIPLFEEESCGINPYPDDVLLDHIRKVFRVEGCEFDGHDGAIQALEKTQLLYRAVGRIMCHSLATNHVLPWNLLPGILRSCKFRIHRYYHYTRMYGAS